MWLIAFCFCFFFILGGGLVRTYSTYTWEEFIVCFVGTMKNVEQNESSFHYNLLSILEPIMFFKASIIFGRIIGQK